MKCEIDLVVCMYKSFAQSKKMSMATSLANNLKKLLLLALFDQYILLHN